MNGQGKQEDNESYQKLRDVDVKQGLGSIPEGTQVTAGH
jgi:hypothetical protein